MRRANGGQNDGFVVGKMRAQGKLEWAACVPRICSPQEHPRKAEPSGQRPVRLSKVNSEIVFPAVFTLWRATSPSKN
jgi:hypothetical protein